MILATVMVSGRSRNLILRPYGDIWPVSASDVQFVMPSTLIDKELVDACWTPEVVELWARGEQESSVEGLGAMMEARRKVSLILRRIVRETERMASRMSTQNMAKGGVEGIWDHFASENPDDRSSVSSVEAAAYLLEQEGIETPEIRPHTLPAFAAHSIMMKEPLLFLADPGRMHETSRFLLRSRNERTRIEEVVRIIHSTKESDQAAVKRFVDNAEAAIELSKALPAGGDEWTSVPHKLSDWTDKERDFIWALVISLYETRSTQDQIMLPILTTLLKAIPSYSNREIDRETLAEFAENIGVLPPWETLRRAEMAEDQIRRESLVPISRQTEPELLKGNELDGIREDLTSQTVFVVDDASSKELDDGVSVERIPGSDDVWIHAHIADPTRLLGRHHPMAYVAAARGSASYYPEGNLSLFGGKQHSVCRLARCSRRRRGAQGCHDIFVQSRSLWRNTGFKGSARMDQEPSNRHIRCGRSCTWRTEVECVVETFWHAQTHRRGRTIWIPTDSAGERRPAPATFHRSRSSPSSNANCRL